MQDEGLLRVRSPFKTDRKKRGLRLVVIESGDLIRIGRQDFSVVRILDSGKLVVKEAMDPSESAGVRSHAV